MAARRRGARGRRRARAPRLSRAGAPRPSRGRGRGEEEPAPREKPSVPGAHLEVDIVPEGVDPLGRERGLRRIPTRSRMTRPSRPRGRGGRARRRSPSRSPPPRSTSPPAPATAPPASARRRSRASRCGRAPALLVNGRTLEEHFPRVTLQRNIRQPLETVGYQERMDVVARLHGGGISAQAGRAAPRRLARAARGRPEPARRAQAPGLPDARLARQGAQEGRPEEGAQASAVLQALAPPARERRA